MLLKGVGPAAVLQQVLLAGHAIVFENDTDQHLVLEAADEEIAAPGRKGLAGEELRAGGSDHRVLVVDRLFEAGARGHGAGDRRARVFLAIRLERPPVVLPLLNEVQLVPAFVPCSITQSRPFGSNAAASTFW